MHADEMLKLLESGSEKLGNELPENMEKFWAFAHSAFLLEKYDELIS